MIIRRATKKDVRELAGLWDKFMEYLQELDSEPLYERSKDSRDEWVKYIKKKRIGKRDSVMFVAEKSRALIGYCMAHVEKNKPIFKVKKYGHCDEFFVLEGYRGKGIGTKLKDTLFDWFKSRRLNYVEIGVLALNFGTIKVYRHWGFKDHAHNMLLHLQ